MDVAQRDDAAHTFNIQALNVLGATIGALPIAGFEQGWGTNFEKLSSCL